MSTWNILTSLCFEYIIIISFWVTIGFLMAVIYANVIFLLRSFLLLGVELVDLWSSRSWISVADILMLITFILKRQLQFFTNKNCVVIYACMYLNYQIVEYSSYTNS